MMSTEIYYFSGTGNSLHVARELQRRIPESSLIPILSLSDETSVTARSEVVGFVFPHYASSLPRVVRTFIEKLDLATARFLFAIVTRGGTKTLAFAEMDGILRERGRRLDAFSAITMASGNDALVKGFADRITEERVARLESAMLAKLDAIQPIILKREVSREEDSDYAEPPAFVKPFVPVLDAISPFLIWLGRMVESSFDFYCDEKCTGCGLCERICLSGKIQMVDDRPVWQDTVRCHGCFACLSFCPVVSIQVESKRYLKSYTEHNGRYHHPAITAEDIAAQKAGLLPLH